MMRIGDMWNIHVVYVKPKYFPSGQVTSDIRNGWILLCETSHGRVDESTK